MSYATLQDLIDRFGERELVHRTNRDGGDTVVEAVVDQALGDAREEINSYIGVRFALPLASVPDLLTRLACDIARYRLYGEAVTEEVRNRYRDAIAHLARIASGDASLALQEPDTTPGGEIRGGEILVESEPRIFGRQRGGL